MIELKQAAEKSKNNMYITLDGVSAYIQQPVHDPQMQPMDQHDVDAENCTQMPYHACFGDILTEYPAWSMDTNDIENNNKAQYREDRQDILNAWQKDTPVKTQDNRQVLDNIEANAQDRLNITQSVTVATVQSNQLTTNIPNYLPSNIATGQQDDCDYQDDREEHLCQVDGTLQTHRHLLTI